MEGFCRGCLIKYDEPTDLIPYSEKNRRLFIYSTGLQVKRNDTFTFQLCKECYLNMKQSCTFKKQCRNSEKKLKNYMSLKEDGDAVDFCSYIKNCEDLLTIRLPLTSGNSTPAHQKSKEDDNESTCTSIRNFMSDILQGEEVPDTEARIIRELIEEEADVLDDSLDSHWLQDDMSIETDFRMDFNFSPFSTPRSIQNDHCYTPKRLNDEKDDYFTLKQIDRQTDEQYHMPILDDCDIDIDQPAIIPMDDIKTDCYDQNKSHNYEINNVKHNESQNYEIKELKLNETVHQNYGINDLDLNKNEFGSYNEVESQHFDINNIKHNEMESQNCEVETVKLNVNKSEETYFVEQLNAIKSNKIEDFLNIGDKTQDFIAVTEIENNFYNITNNSNQSKVGKVIDESSLLNNELEYYISKAKLKKKSDVINDKCLIDRNLETALENEDNKEIPLDILISSPKVDIRSGASTPTIRNILFGDTILDSDDSPKLSQCIEKYQPIEGQTNILDDFLKDEDSNNIENVKVKEEFVPNNTSNSFDIVKSKVEILEIKVIKERHDKDRDIGNNLIEREDEKTEDIRDLIDDYVTNVYDKIDITEKDKVVEIDALELLKATNKTLDDSLFKKPLSPLYDKYDLETSQCKICNKNFKTQINLKIHFAKKHKFKIVNNVKKVNNTRVEICDICGKTIEGKANLNRHKRKIHGGQFPCTECLLEFHSEYGLTIHKRSHKENLIKIKSKPKVYAEICNICGKKVSTANHKIHLLRHLKDFKFKCEICDRGFYRQGDYNIHLGTHTTDRPYTCQICPKAYKRRLSLIEHNKRHLVQQEFTCNICSTRFTSKRMLRYHFGTKMCNPANKITEEQHNIDTNKTSDEQLTQDNNKKLLAQCKLAKNMSLEQGNPDNNTPLEQCTPANNKSLEQCTPAYNTPLEQCTPANNTPLEQCKLDNKKLVEQYKLARSKSVEQCKPAKNTSEEQCKPANNTIEEPFKSANFKPELLTEEIMTEEIEYTVKFSPISYKEDERSDPLLHLN